MRARFDPFFGHAVDTAQVASVSERDAQIVYGASEAVFQTMVRPVVFRGLFRSARSVRHEEERFRREAQLNEVSFLRKGGVGGHVLVDIPSYMSFE